MTDLKDVLTAAAGAGSAAALALSGDARFIVQLLATAAGAASVMLDTGMTQEEIIKTMHKLSRLDVAEDDEKINALIRQLPKREAP